MKVLTFAAGMAAGYVLGAKAGGERYEQIVDGFRQLTRQARRRPGEDHGEERD